jgi:N-formylglutamate deformylase
MRRRTIDRLDGDEARIRPPFEFPEADAAPALVATAIHAGHDLRPEVRSRIAVDESTRRREEDPHTDRIIAEADAPVLVRRSRFEVDLNRARDDAIYRDATDAWGLDPWKGSLRDDVMRVSLGLHDRFYEQLATLLDGVADDGPFVVLDVHSYNHRRHGPDQPPDPQECSPDVNIGTTSVDRERWAAIVDGLIATLGDKEVDGARLDVRENVRFGGAHLAEWVNRRYAGTGCAIAVEFKKTFMDEWSGQVDEDRLRRLAHAFITTLPVIERVVCQERR